MATAAASIDALIALAGDDVTVAPLPSAGFSTASLTRLTSCERRFVLKRTTLARDWTAWVWWIDRLTGCQDDRMTE